MVAFFLLLCILVVAVLVALLVPGVWDRLVELVEGNAESHALAREFGEDLLEQGHRPERQLDRLDPRCKPMPDDDLQAAEYDALVAFAAYIDELQGTDDPTVWPDDDLAEQAVADVVAAWVAAACQAEVVAPTARAGAAVEADLRRAAKRWVDAQGHGAPPAVVLAGLARVVLLRARQKEFRHAGGAARHALRLANAALELQPRSPGARLAQAECHVALGRVDAAKPTVMALMNERDQEAAMQRVRARWLAAQGDWRGAVDAILDRLDRLPAGEATAERFRLGPLLVDARRFEEAKKLYQQLRAEAPDEAAVWTGLARVALFSKEYGDAEQAARAAIEQGAGAEARDVLRQAMVHTRSPS